MTEAKYFDDFLKSNNLEYVDYASYEYDLDDFKNVIDGTKIAEISLYDDYIKNEEPLPTVGDYAVLSFVGERCIIRNKEIKILK